MYGPGTRRAGREERGMARVGIIGSGNAGANTAFFIAEKGVSEVLLHDIKEGLSTGKALDLMEAAPVRRYRTRITGTDSLDEVLECPVLVVAAGSIRMPEMERDDLFDKNVEILRELGKRLEGRRDDLNVIVVTEPVDPMTTILTELSGLPREHVMGVGGLLDSTRLRFALARDLDVSVDDVSALVIGRHNDQMIGLAGYATVSGVPVLNLMNGDHFDGLMAEVRGAGDFIVGLAKRSSSYYAPSAAVAELVDAVVRDTRRLMSVSILLKGEYGVEGVAMSIPAIIGRSGVERVILPKVGDHELERFRSSARDMKHILNEG
jgi:malate dehydrogenase